MSYDHSHMHGGEDSVLFGASGTGTEVKIQYCSG